MYSQRLLFWRRVRKGVTSFSNTRQMCGISGFWLESHCQAGSVNKLLQYLMANFPFISIICTPMVATAVPILFLYCMMYTFHDLYHQVSSTLSSPLASDSPQEFNNLVAQWQEYWMNLPRFSSRLTTPSTKVRKTNEVAQYLRAIVKDYMHS